MLEHRWRGAARARGLWGRPARGDCTGIASPFDGVDAHLHRDDERVLVLYSTMWSIVPLKCKHFVICIDVASAASCCPFDSIEALSVQRSASEQDQIVPFTELSERVVEVNDVI